MGKLDNIKRARQLKEAKRKREMDAAIEAGTSPAGMDLKKRVAMGGNKIIMNNSGIKYSELLEAFVLPLLSGEDNIETIKGKFAFGALVWNAAIMREQSEDLYLKVKKDFIATAPEISDAGQLFEDMARIKKDNFSVFNNIISDFEIKKISGIDFELFVTTIPAKYL